MEVQCMDLETHLFSCHDTLRPACNLWRPIELRESRIILLGLVLDPPLGFFRKIDKPPLHLPIQLPVGSLCICKIHFPGLIHRQCDFPRDFLQELYDLSNVVVIFAVAWARRGLKEIVSSGDKLKYLTRWLGATL